MIAFEGVPQIVEKEDTNPKQDNTDKPKWNLAWERVLRSFRLFYCHVYPQIMMVALEVSIMALFSQAWQTVLHSVCMQCLT